jgi:hypothetical protein
MTVNFTDSSSDSDGSIASRSWNFGDSTSSHGDQPEPYLLPFGQLHRHPDRHPITAASTKQQVADRDRRQRRFDAAARQSRSRASAVRLAASSRWNQCRCRP